ncbi:MAG: hypothetical protein WCK55_06155 [Verrucomicrobiota bacterium]
MIGEPLNFLMKYAPKTLFLVAITALLTACNRPKNNAELQQLKEEVERLKAEQAAKLAKPAEPVESPDYKNFLHVSRRLMTAIESGTSLQDFHERGIEVLAAAKEAYRVTQSPERRRDIELFANAISDVEAIWRNKLTERNSYLNYTENFRKRNFRASGGECGERWDTRASELIALYKLDKTQGDLENLEFSAARLDKDGAGLININGAIQKIFRFCSETFRALESPPTSVAH